MGRVKEDWMEAESRGWAEVEKSVCAACLDHPDLWQLAESGASEGECDYCGNEETPVLPVSAVQELLYAAMGAYYAEPTQAGTPVDEGSFIVEPIDTDEVLERLGFEPCPELWDDLLEANMVGAWVPAADGHWAGSHEHQIMLGSWSTFAEVVKHQTRFHFQRVPREGEPQEIEVADVLGVIANELAPLVRVVPVGTNVYRARNLPLADARAIDRDVMGAPPKDRASAGRMNPAGIPYFYSSLDARTAFAEIGDPPAGKVGVVACTRSRGHHPKLIASVPRTGLG